MTTDVLSTLNPQQLEAVLHVEGPMLTLAGPGSGKTRVVTQRIVNLLNQGISPYEILALTFTNKAAAEMRKRVEAFAPNAPVWVGTFHGYCARFLRTYARHVGLIESYTIFDTDDAKKVMQLAIEDAKVSLTHLNVSQIIHRISDLKNKLVTPEMMQGSMHSALDTVVSKVYPAYQKRLLQNAAVDFDDLLVHTAVILRTCPEIRQHLDKRHRFILVDEYQDTNLAQYLIVRALSIDHPNLNVTGDPDQSVYSWRGANIENILKFEQDYPNVKTVRLEQNYRSTPEILSVADALIKNNSRRKEKTLIPTKESGSAVRLVTYRDDRMEAEDIANQILMAIQENGASASDFAILYRTNAQSRLLERELLACRLNYQLIGGFRFYHRQEIKDLLAYLRLLYNPSDDVAFSRAVNTPTRGLGDKSIEKVRDVANERSLPMLSALRLVAERGGLSKAATRGANQFLGLIEKLAKMTTGSLVELLKVILTETDYITYIDTKKSSDKEDESIQENVDELLADAAEVDAKVETGNALEVFLEQVSLFSDTDSLDVGSGQVTLMTLHAAKGLEFKHVYIIAVEENVLPHIRSLDDPNQYEEERRLFFVGITRAQQTLQLSLTKKRGFSRFSVPSSFLMELPRIEMEISDRSDPFYDADLEYSDNGPDFMDDYINQDLPSSGLGSKSKRVSGSHVDNEFAEIQIGVPDAEEEPQLDQDHEPLHRKMIKLKKLSLASLKPAAQIAPVSTTSGAQVDDFRVDAEVHHPKYGNGYVVSLDGRSTKRMARVRFDDGQIKSFLLASSPLTLLR